KDKGARRGDPAQAADVAMNAVDEATAVRRRGAGTAFLDHPRPVVEQGAVDKGRPAVEDGDHLARQTAKPPAAIGLDRQLLVIPLQCTVEIDDTADKARRKDADAAKVEEVDGAVGGHGV